MSSFSAPKVITPFEKVGERFLEIIIKDQLPDEATPVLGERKTLDDRLSEDRFYYFQNENRNVPTTCFEQNTYFYFSLKELYPDSNPALICLEGEGVNTHASVLFTHEGQLYFADPVSNAFGPAQIDSDKIILLEDFENGKQYNFPFTGISQVPDTTLREIINHLRTPDGILSFFYGSGNIVSKIIKSMYPKELFMYIDDDFTIHGQLRINDVEYSGDRGFMHIQYSPFSDEYAFSAHRYESSNWRSIRGRKDLEENIPRQKKQLVHLQDITKFLNETQMSFRGSENNTKRIQLMELNGYVPEDIQKAVEWGSDFLNYYVDFTMAQEGSDFGKKPPSFEDFFGTTQMVGGEPIKVLSPGLITNAHELLLKDVYDMNRLQMFMLAHDFKRYAQIVKSHI